MGALSKQSGSGRPRPAMNVTPLVDIVLVLLIIFMVVLPNQEKGAAVEVPTLEHAEDDPDDGEEPFTLSIDRNGRLFFEADEVDEETLLTRLDAAHASEPERKILLRADRTVPYGSVRDIFKTAQEVGFPGVMMRVGGQAGSGQAPGAVAAGDGAPSSEGGG